MEYQPKTFAIGEVLTAQDVNEYLVSRIRRTVFQGAQLGEILRGSLFAGSAIVDEDSDGNRLVSVSLNIGDHGGLNAGAQNTSLFVMAPELRPTSYTPAALSAATLGIVGGIFPSGTAAARWTSGSAGNGTTIGISATYAVTQS